MSLNAFIWTSNLPLDIVGPTAFRILLKYADRVDKHGRAAWYTTTDLAEELGCSPRTVQRAIRELVQSGLIQEGDQRFVSHLRGDRRPTVYDINLGAQIAPRLTIEDVDDTTPDDTPHGVTNMSRGDNLGPHGVTTGVAHRTVIEHIKSNNLSTEGRDDVAPSRIPAVPPAPRYPTFQPDPVRVQPEPRTPEEDTAVEMLSSVECPSGFGEGKHSRHWFPGTLTGCARCGAEALDLISELHTEGAPA